MSEMTPRLRRLAPAIVALCLALALGCGSADAPTPTPTETPQPPHTPTIPAPTPAATLTPAPPQPSKQGVNLIAYVDPNGQVKTVSPDGSSAARISPDEGFFTWPMWSPDASQIVFSGTASEGGGRGPLAMYVHRLGDERPRVLYTNEPGMGPILAEMPHYPLWAPDGGRLAFMASAPQGLTLFLADPQVGGDAAVVLRSAPLYASWSANSRHLLVHGGADHFLVDVEGEAAVRDLGVRADRYRVPAWWPPGDRMALISLDATGSRGLYLTSIESGQRTLIEDVSAEAAFLWSPNGESLAVTQSELPGGVIYSGVRLFSPDGTRLPVEIDDDVVAFFWSPDSSKLAYVTLSESRGVLRWMVLNVADGSRWPLAEFIPSGAQLTLFQFFDQFAYSHSMWSPDSGSLVFAGNLSDGAVSASMARQSASRIFVMGVRRFSSADPIADGFLAVWSPR